MVTYLGSPVQLCCGEGGTLPAHITGVCGPCSQCLGHTSVCLPPLTACVLSSSTLLRLRVALQGNCPKQALGFVHFPGLSRSGSGSRVLHKGTDSAGPEFCALPRSEQVRRPGAWRVHSRQVGGASYHLPGPSHSVSPAWCSRSAASGVPCASSGGLISDCDPSGGCQPSRIPQVSNWGPAHSLVEDAISGAEIAPCLPALVVACLPLFLWWGDGPVCSPLSPFWCLLSRLLSKWARLPLGLSFFGESSLSHSFSLSLSGYPTVWVAISR